MTQAMPLRSLPRGARALILAWVAGLVVSIPGSAAGLPLAGSTIDNTAIGTGQDALSGASFTLSSNTVTALVQPVERVELLHPGSATVPPGAAHVFAHELANRGNVTTDFRLDVVNLAGDGFDAIGFTLTHDRNRDGVVDAGDIPVAVGGVLTLAPGDSAQLLLSAGAPANAPGLSTAWFRISATGLAQGASASLGDTLLTPAPRVEPTLAFYTGTDFARPARVTALGVPLYLQAVAPQCDLDPAAVDTVRITLRSRLTGDVKVVAGIETAPASGVFRVDGAPVTTAQAVSSGGGPALALARGDEVTAVLAGCGSTVAQAQVYVEPAGVVFDARTDAPVAAARVQLIDVTGAGNGGAPGALARVYAPDGVTPASADVWTDGAGRFTFSWVPASTYRLVVTPPSPWSFPSQVPVPGLPPGHALDAAGSYAGPFPIVEDGAPLLLDVPVDAHGSVTLFAEKTASVPAAEWGDDIEYRVRVANRSDSTLAAVEVRDQLPSGLSLVHGSVRLDGAPAPDPAGRSGALVAPLGPMAPHAEVELRYRARVGPGTPAGDAINAAIAWSGPHASNTASARVRIGGDAFLDDAHIVGTVSLAPAAAPAPGGPGLAGVRLYLDDGTFAITDERGRYSFTGVTPRTHALKLDATTLPRGARPLALSHRDGDRAGVRFVDLVRGELAHVDFAVAGDTTATREAGERRIAASARGVDERARVLGLGLSPLAGPRPAGDLRALPASRITTGETSLPVFAAEGGAVGPAAAFAPAAAAEVVTLDQLLPTLPSDLGFVGLSDLDTVDANQVAVVVKGRLGTTLALRVNGMLLPESRVGRRVAAARQGLEAWEYVGVRLQPGVNLLELAPPRSHGRVALRLVAPGPFARLTLAAPATVRADGHSLAALELDVTDAAGVPVGARTLVTVDSPQLRVRADDLDPATPGTQVAVEHGRLVLALVAPDTPVHATIVASSGEVRGSARVDVIPDLRPLLAVGAFEGVVSLRGLGAHGAAVGRVPAAGFESPIDQFVAERRDGRAAAASHGAVFMKGELRPGTLVTMGYDSDRPGGERQFRDQQPDRGYALFGDAATRGYEAQSTGRLYARMEQQGRSLAYGDFVTTPVEGRVLGQYGRSLTGASSRWEQGRIAVAGFTSRERSRHQVDELRGLGTSGPYVLTRRPIVPNSERVEIVVRDRAQPTIVRSASARERFTDYELEPLTGRLLFRSPVPSVDADLDPVSVRVTYEVEDGGEPAWVHGVEGRVALNARFDLGGTYVDDHDPAAPFELRGLNGTAHLGGHTTLDAEWASTRRAGRGEGDAARLELKHEGARAQARLYGLASAATFDNPGAGFGGGRREAGGRFTARLDGLTRLNAEGLFSANSAGAGAGGGVLVSVDRTLGRSARGDLGLRWSRLARSTGPLESATTAVRARLTAQPPAHPALSGYAEAEQDTRAWERHLAALGGEYRFSPRARLYTRHELLSSLSSGWALSTTQQQAASVLGIDADVSPDAHVFSEYRLSDAMAGREAQAAVGLRNVWAIENGMRLGTSFERVAPLRGSTAGASTALTASVDWADDPAWKGSARMEARTSHAVDQFLQGMSAAVRLDSSWTLITRHLLTVDDRHPAGGEARERLQLAFAWRSSRGWDALGRYEFRYQQTRDPGASRERLVASIAGLDATRHARAWNGTFGWAGKLTRREGEVVTPGGAQWLRGRLTRDVGRAWDCGVTASVLAGRRIAQHQYGLGAEIGRMLPGGTWLSFGFNRFGFRDDELADQEWTRQGAYLRMRLKFDETSFAGATGGPR